MKQGLLCGLCYTEPCWESNPGLFLSGEVLWTTKLQDATHTTECGGGAVTFFFSSPFTLISTTSSCGMLLGAVCPLQLLCPENQKGKSLKIPTS